MPTTICLWWLGCPDRSAGCGEPAVTIQEAMRRGLTAIRKPHWAFEDDRLELQMCGGKDGNAHYGPWATLVSPQTARALNDESYHRQQVLIVGDQAEDWVEFQAPQQA